MPSATLPHFNSISGIGFLPGTCIYTLRAPKLVAKTYEWESVSSNGDLGHCLQDVQVCGKGKLDMMESSQAEEELLKSINKHTPDINNVPCLGNHALFKILVRFRSQQLVRKRKRALSQGPSLISQRK